MEKAEFFSDKEYAVGDNVFFGGYIDEEGALYGFRKSDGVRKAPEQKRYVFEILETFVYGWNSPVIKKGRILEVHN